MHLVNLPGKKGISPVPAFLVFGILSCMLVAFSIRPAFAQARVNPPIVVLNFDDAETNQYLNVAPLLKKYGFGATFMVCEMPLRPPADSSYYMTWQQVKDLHQQGFEIGNHTGHHKNMTTMSREEAIAEVTYIENKCRQFGIPKPVSFAYPGNRIDSASQVLLKELGYRYARTGYSRYYEPGKDAPLAIPSYTMGSTEKLQPRTLEALENLKPGQILVFTIHGIPDTVHPDYTTSVPVFTRYLDLMRDRKYHVIALRDLDRYIKP